MFDKKWKKLSLKYWQRYQRFMEFDWPKPHSTKINSLKCYLSSSCDDSLHVELKIMDRFVNLISWETNQQKVVVSGATFPWWLSICKKTKKKNTGFFPQLLMIKESCNLIRWKTQLTTHNWKWYSQMPMSSSIKWSEKLLIKVYCNLIGPVTQIANTTKLNTSKCYLCKKTISIQKL